MPSLPYGDGSEGDSEHVVEEPRMARGVQDGDEAGIDGVVVQLPDGSPVATTTVLEESEEEVKQEEAEELFSSQQRCNGTMNHAASATTTTGDNKPNQVVVDCWGCGCRFSHGRANSGHPL